MVSLHSKRSVTKTPLYQILIFLLFNFLLILCGFRIMHPNPHLPLPLYLPSALGTFPLREATRPTAHPFAHTSLLAFTAHPFAHTSLLASIAVSLWSGFPLLNTGSSPGLFSDSLLLPCVMGILQLWISRSDPKLVHFKCPSSSRMGQIRALDLRLGGS